MIRVLTLAAVSLCALTHAQPGAYAGPAELLEGARLPVAFDAGGSDTEQADLFGEIEDEVKRTGGQALVIARDGHILHAWFEDEQEPIELMSATKSVVAIGIGALIDDGHLDSIETPVSSIIPEFDGEGCKNVTIRMLLDHTSGLAGAFATNEIYQAESALAYAIESDCAFEPGSTFRYNNNAVNLLMGVIERSTGMPPDEYIASRVLAPLGITNWSWYRDPSGGAHGMAGLRLDAVDAARIGQLMLDGGAFQGRQIVSEGWVDSCLTPATDIYPKCGLLWWLTPEMPWDVTLHEPTIDGLLEAGFLDPDQAGAMRSMAGRTGERDAFIEQLTSILGGEEAYNELRSAQRELGLWLVRDVAGEVGAYAAQGYLGQLIIAVPGTNFVVVRQQSGRDHPVGVDMQLMLDLAMRLE